MKKTLALILASVLIGTLGVGCNKYIACDYGPEAFHCVIYVNTTPGAEAVLLAQSKLYSYKARYDIYVEYVAGYGEENIKWGEHDPYHVNCKTIAPASEAPNCYEITMMVEFSDNYHPTIDALLDYHYYDAVKYVDAHTIIGKIYHWGFTKKSSDDFAKSIGNLYKKYGQGEVTNITIKNLGKEVHDRLIVFE